MTYRKIVMMGILCLQGCALSQQTIDTTDLSQLQNMSPRGAQASSTQVSQMRLKMLEDTALTLGAQAGLAKESEKINRILLKDQRYLGTVFNFAALILGHGVLPPVFVESNNNLNIDNPNALRISDKTYKIIQQAQFVTTPPTWRTYLWMSYEKPEVPNKTLLPRDATERQVWRRSIQTGWEKGVEQANSIFQQNLAKLQQDFQGMILYRRLLAQKMVSPPFVSKTELGVTGDGNVMHINDQVLRIAVLPQLQMNSQQWRPRMVIKNER